MLDDAAVEILAQKQEVLRLKAVADQHPFYKYNSLWTRELQNLVRINPSNACCVSEYLILTPVLGLLDRAVCLARRTAGAQGPERSFVPDY